MEYQTFPFKVNAAKTWNELFHYIGVCVMFELVCVLLCLQLKKHMCVYSCFSLI